MFFSWGHFLESKSPTCRCRAVCHMGDVSVLLLGVSMKYTVNRREGENTMQCWPGAALLKWALCTQGCTVSTVILQDNHHYFCLNGIKVTCSWSKKFWRSKASGELGLLLDPDLSHSFLACLDYRPDSSVLSNGCPSALLYSCNTATVMGCE